MKNPYKQAEVRRRARRDFLVHLGLFAVSVPAILLIDRLIGSGSAFAVGLILVWLLGLALHALSLLEPLKTLTRLLDRLAG